MSKLNVKVGDRVAVVVGWGKNDSILGIAAVRSISATGRITVVPAGSVNSKNPSDRDIYDAEGRPRGRSSGRIRELREDEDADAIMAAKKVEQEAKWAKVKADNDAQQARDQEAAAACMVWVSENAQVTRVPTINTALYVVELPVKDQPCTLVVRFDEQTDTWDGRTAWNASIMVNHTRQGGRMDGGITSDYGLEQPNAYQVAAHWLKSWVGVDNL